MSSFFRTIKLTGHWLNENKLWLILFILVSLSICCFSLNKPPLIAEFFMGDNSTFELSYTPNEKAFVNFAEANYYHKTVLNESVTFQNGSTSRISGSVVKINPSQEEAFYLSESGRSFLLFYAVLIFTCVTIIVELISKIKKHPDKFFLLYFVLLITLTVSIGRCFTIYSEIIRLEKSGLLGIDIEKQMRSWHNSPFVSILASPWFPVLCICTVFIFFSCLFLWEKHMKYRSI